MMAEQTTWDISRERGLNLVVVVPSVTLGPMLQPTLNESVVHLTRYILGGRKAFPNAVQAYVHVKDVAAAHILVYETPSADLMGLLTDMFPQYHITNRCETELSLRVKPYRFSNRRLTDLGLTFIPVKQALYETVVFGGKRSCSSRTL